MRSQFVDIGAKIKQALLPQQCVLCAAASGLQAFCADCAADLPWHDEPACPVCALPSPSSQVCGACLQHPPAFDATCAALDYAFPIDAVLQRYKYYSLLSVAEPLAELLLAKLQGRILPDIIIPMPLHPQRLRARGFNQVLEIGRGISRKLRVPLDAHVCQRTRPTPPQAGLALEVRRKNLRGVFACHSSLAGKHVALLDDVMTTGASLEELARTVKDAGATRVECWTVARTLRNRN